MSDECAIFAGDLFDTHVLPDVELVVIGDATVIFEGFRTHRLVVQRGHGDIADFQQLGRGEEHHVVGVVIDGVDDAALIDQDGANAALFKLDAAGEARWTRANDDNVDDVARIHYSIASTLA